MVETRVHPRRTTLRRDAGWLPRSAWALVRRHVGLLVLVAAAAALRVTALVAIYPGIWFSDSNSYIKAAATGTLSTARVDGYALAVAPFWHAGSAGALILLQHVIGVGIVVLLYALLLRRGVPRWLALLAVVPAALDAYLVVLEHAVMSETVFHAAIAAAIALLLWNERPHLAGVAAAGLLLGYAGVVRSVAVPFVAVVVLYLLIRRVGWMRVVAFCVGWGLIASGYATLFRVQHGKFGFTTSSARFLYARVAPFADCSQLKGLPADERSLCPDPRHRLKTNGYLWSNASPIRGLGPSADPRIRDFAIRVIRARPVTYAHVVAAGVLHYFEPGHRIGHNDYPVSTWQFPADPRHSHYPGYRGPIRPTVPRLYRRHPTSPSRYVNAMVVRPRFDVGASRFLHGYQRYAYTYGPLMALCVLVAVAALVIRRGAWRLRLDAALLVVMVLSALVVSQALSVFSYRYGLIAAVFLPVAGGLAVTALLEGRRPAEREVAAPPPGVEGRPGLVGTA